MHRSQAGVRPPKGYLMLGRTQPESGDTGSGMYAGVAWAVNPSFTNP